MIKDVLVFALAHLGAFMVIRDILETAGIRAIQDANGQSEFEGQNFAQDAGEYVLSRDKCSESETMNYLFFGDAMARYVFSRVRSGRVKQDLSFLMDQIKMQLGKEDIVTLPVESEEVE